MSSKIFRSIWLAAILVFIVTLIFIMGISYHYFSLIQLNQMRHETELAAQGVEISGMGYFENLNTEGYRITWIDSDGNVLYDNEANRNKMVNHLEREEVKQALTDGYGVSVRYSSTLAEKQIYAAQLLPDGTVVRLSIVQQALWTLFFGFAQPISFVVFIALILSFFLASRLAAKIVKPINEIDTKHPEQYYGKENYKEVEPLLRHISEQQYQLKKDQAQIAHMAMIRQEFTANVSHELKTPLHAISGYAELLENGMVKEADVIPFAGKIHGESMRLTKLVEDIIDLTKLDNDGAELEWESCDLYRIASEAVAGLEAAAEDADVTITLNGADAPVNGVTQMLYSIVYNLCENAIKYNRRGGTVDINITQSEEKTILTVRDTGIGIPQESVERIFERFYRVDKSRSKAVGGTGLGLSIVKHAVMIHKGTIDVNSEVGKGSEFVITLPNR